MLTPEESLSDLLFIKVCILNALLGPECWEGRRAFVSAPFESPGLGINLVMPGLWLAWQCDRSDSKALAYLTWQEWE